MATLREDDDQDDTIASQEEHVEVEQDKPVEKPEVEVIEDNGTDERLNQVEDEDEDDERPTRQRETAAQRRARQKLAKERDKKELDFQARVIAEQEARIKRLEQNTTVSRVTELDNRIATALSEVDQFDRIKAAALNAKNGDDFVKADNLRNQAAAKANQFMQERQQVVTEANRPQPKPVPYLDKAQAFMRDVPWYNPQGQDADSKLIIELDNEVAKEYLPTSDKYWQELKRRVKKHFPEKFEAEVSDDDNEQEEAPVQRTRKGPPVGGSSRSSNSSSATQIRLSPERVQAMKEAGMWEDPVLRAKMAKKYATYDKQNSRG